MVPQGPRNMPSAQTPSSSSMSRTRSGHVVHATAEVAAGRRAGSHPNIFVFVTQRRRPESGKAKSYLFLPPGEASCSHTTAWPALLASFSAPLLLPLLGWNLLLSSVRVEHH